MEKQSPHKSFSRNSDDIDVMRILSIFWAARGKLVAGTTLVTLVGVLYALLATPIYYAQAIISPKEINQGGASRIFSQMGGVGGVVASQFGMGNATLDKMEVLLKGHEIAQSAIQRHDLLPILFPDLWNAPKQTWKPQDPKDIPSLWDGIGKIRENVLVVNVDIKKNMIRLGMNFPDSVEAKKLVDYYIAALNEKLRNDVISDAETNRRFLEQQLNVTSDPFLREKILAMISYEVEKTMLVNVRAFEVLETPHVPLKRAKPKRKIIVLMAFALGLVFSLGSVLAWHGFTGRK